MYNNLQSDGLTKALLKSNNPELLYFAFEPIQVKKTDLKLLQIGDLIKLGKQMPLVYIYKQELIVGQAMLGMLGDCETAVISAKERVVNPGSIEPDYVVLKAKIAILPNNLFTIGKSINLPIDSMKNILLAQEYNFIAKTSLLQDNNNRYYLKIIELL